jgi:hypothetical protein
LGASSAQCSSRALICQIFQQATIAGSKEMQLSQLAQVGCLTAGALKGLWIQHCTSSVYPQTNCKFSKSRKNDGWQGWFWTGPEKTALDHRVTNTPSARRIGVPSSRSRRRLLGTRGVHGSRGFRNLRAIQEATAVSSAMAASTSAIAWRRCPTRKGHHARRRHSSRKWRHPRERWHTRRSHWEGRHPRHGRQHARWRHAQRATLWS